MITAESQSADFISTGHRNISVYLMQKKMKNVCPLKALMTCINMVIVSKTLWDIMKISDQSGSRGPAPSTRMKAEGIETLRDSNEGTPNEKR